MPFQWNKEEEDKPMMVLGGTVEESSADQEIHKSDMTVHNLSKIWRPAPSGTRSYSRLDEVWVRLEI